MGLILCCGLQCCYCRWFKREDSREIVINQKHCKTAKIATAIADADVVISMNHFKGHERLLWWMPENIGMGCGSVGGKLEMHSNSKPVVNWVNCTACRVCEKNCAHDAIHVMKRKWQKLITISVLVAASVSLFASHAVQVTGSHRMQEKMAEYAYAH